MNDPDGCVMLLDLVTGGNIARRRAEQLAAIRDVRQLTPQGFEKYTAFLYRQMGYKTRVRGGSGDGGVDVEARGNNQYIVIQCKHYTKTPVGSPEIRNLLGTVQIENAHKGILITTSTFTKPAKETARGSSVSLVDMQGIVNLQKELKLGPYQEKEGDKGKVKTGSPFSWWQFGVLFILALLACLILPCATLAILSAIVPPA